jgi:hypothetical protein
VEAAIVQKGRLSDAPPIAGPYREIELPGGASIPFYVIPFDEEGICSGPVTRAHLISELSARAPTDVFLFSHGWNNTWPAAIARYDSFITGFARTRGDHPLPGAQDFDPILIGVFWPSAVLVTEEEEGPVIAAGGADDAAVPADLAELATVARAVSRGDRERFYELAQLPELSGDEAQELAAILTPVWSDGPADDELGPVTEAVSAHELVDVWEEIDRSQDRGSPDSGSAPIDFGFGDEPSGADPPVAADPGVAGVFDGLRRLSPRNLVRTTTVRMMKDRAGRVGGHGVHDLLRDSLSATDARVHLIGHSYGGKVVLSALCSGDLPRPVDSVLLLQPAVSHLCFAADVPGLDQPGGYRDALSPTRVRRPVRTTFSSHDAPLTRFFHLALRRRTDLGEIAIAGEPPGRYAALGGFGPGGLSDEGTVEPAQDPGEPYAHGDRARVIGVESSRVISGHGDISNPWTWWMLVDQIREGG